MNINNPTTFSAPDLTFSTSNSSGTSGALRADDQIALYSASSTTTVASSQVVGTAETASRSDHVHVGIAAVTSTDEAITRYTGTGGQVQNYTSLAPTISDAGIISLTSGALKFPATQIASADANTVDDYEIGTWTPTIEDSDHSDKSQTYGTRAAQYIRIGDLVYVDFSMAITGLGSLTTSSAAAIGGLPFSASSTVSSTAGFMTITTAVGLNITAGENMVALIAAGNSYASCRLWDAATGTTSLLISELSADLTIKGGGVYRA